MRGGDDVSRYKNGKKNYNNNSLSDAKKRKAAQKNSASLS